MTTTPIMVSSASALNALLLCGVMGVVGQGARAAIGLKNARALADDKPGPQAAFNVGYFALSLMIGFIAGVLAGFVVGLQSFTTVDLANPKLLLGVAVSGYAGADFIENAISIVLPRNGAASPAPDSTSSAGQTTTPTPTPPPPPPPPSPPVSVVPPLAPGNHLEAALQIVLPRVNTASWLPALIAAFEKYDLNSNRRIAAALGQFAVEAGASFQEIVENLNYTTAERLHEIFPHEFPTVESAESYVRHPEMIGNRVYANRLGNGDEASGDGFRFRGRGLIQLTGRDEYAEFGATLGKTPEEASAYAETTEGAAMSGCWYLASRGCLSLADAWSLSAITKKVNGAAMLGNAQRIAYANAFLKHLG